MALYLIRHGETAGNAERVVQFPHTPLNERGMDQARRLGERLTEAKPALIVASDYVRARMTAEVIQSATGGGLLLDERLRERHFGDWRGRSHDTLGDIYAAGRVPPNGESWDAFHARVDTAWQAIHAHVRQTGGRIAVVTHGLVCYSLAARHLSLPAGVEAGIHFHNTALTVIDPVPPWRVTRYNCTAHLDTVDAVGGV